MTLLRRMAPVALLLAAFTIGLCARSSAVAGPVYLHVRPTGVYAGSSRIPGASLRWRPFFVTAKRHKVKVVELLYSPATLYFNITNECEPSLVKFTLTGSGQKRGLQYNDYSVEALTKEAYNCPVIATAPNAQIRSTLQVTVKSKR